MNSRRQFLYSLAGTCLIPTISSSANIVTTNQYESVLPNIINTQRVTPGEDILLIHRSPISSREISTNASIYSPLFGIHSPSYGKGDDYSLAVSKIPTSSDYFSVVDDYQNDKRIIEYITSKSEQYELEMFPQSKDLIVASNRLAIRNRRGAGNVLLCNPKNYSSFKSSINKINWKSMQVFQSEFVSDNSALMLLKGQQVWDGIGIIGVNKSDPRYKFCYMRDIENYATFITWK